MFAHDIVSLNFLVSLKQVKAQIVKKAVKTSSAKMEREKFRKKVGQSNPTVL